MVSYKVIACLVVAAFPSLSLAHPQDGAEAAKLLDLHRRTAAVGSRALDQCSNSIEARSYSQAAASGRVETLNAIRQAAGLGPGKTPVAASVSIRANRKAVPKLSSRNLDDLKHWEDKNVVNHDKTGQVGNPDDAWSKTKSQCAFVPENIIGPYYYPGELVRSDISEGQAGIPMWLDVQLIDVNTCKPIQGMTVDTWAVSGAILYEITFLLIGNTDKRNWKIQSHTRQRRPGRYRHSLAAWSSCHR